MSATKRTGAWLAAMIAASMIACGDDAKKPALDGGSDGLPDGGLLDAEVDAQAAEDAQTSDAQLSPDADVPDAATKLRSCLPRPGELPAAPSSGLPCELLPPGLEL